MWARIRRLSVLSVAAIGLGGCSLLTPLPDKARTPDRLASFPTGALPVSRPVTIHWDKYQIPFVEAQTDDDAAFALGLVHAHLRLGQMEVLRRISQGRLAEVAGPLAVDIDHSLRILDYGRGADRFIAEMPPETRRWMENFVRGVNYYQRTMKTVPHEYKLLDLKREPWTVKDLLAIGRLAGTDVNWLAYLRFIQLRERKDWPQIWAALTRLGSDSVPSFEKNEQARLFQNMIAGNSRSGSNAVVVSGKRTATGAALIESDPHLGVTVPNLWLIAGVRSPSYHSVGLMVPGLPFVAVGRNPDIAWGGTNMRAASSDLYDISALPKSAIRTRTEKIKVRWWFPRTVRIRETDIGPVLSDAPVLNWKGKPFALRWVGHEKGDEITAMLRVMKARNWGEFRESFKTFAVSAQNMVYADRSGNIGMVMATILPIRPNTPPDDFIRNPVTEKWRGFLDVTQLPASFNPAKGFLGSANNRPTRLPVPVGYIFSPDDRIERIDELMRGNGRVTLDDLKKLQLDVYMKSSVDLRDALVRRVAALGVEKTLTPEGRKVLALMREWDGHYRAESRGPVAFELFIGHFQPAFYEPRFGEKLAAYVGFGRNKRLLLEDLRKAGDAKMVELLTRALDAAGRDLPNFATWGDMHRLAIAHPLSAAPVLGGKYRFLEIPVAGSSDTLMKTAHSTTTRRHTTRYGQQARFLADLSDADKNFFVLLGGQDGWFNSANALDHMPLWQKGKYITVPLKMETVRRSFEKKTVLRPAQ